MFIFTGMILCVTFMLYFSRDLCCITGWTYRDAGSESTSVSWYGWTTWRLPTCWRKYFCLFHWLESVKQWIIPL